MLIGLGKSDPSTVVSVHEYIPIHFRGESISISSPFHNVSGFPKWVAPVILHL